MGDQWRKRILGRVPRISESGIAYLSTKTPTRHSSGEVEAEKDDDMKREKGNTEKGNQRGDEAKSPPVFSCGTWIEFPFCLHMQSAGWRFRQSPYSLPKPLAPSY